MWNTPTEVIHASRVPKISCRHLTSSDKKRTALRLSFSCLLAHSQESTKTAFPDWAFRRRVLARRLELAKQAVPRRVASRTSSPWNSWEAALSTFGNPGMHEFFKREVDANQES